MKLHLNKTISLSPGGQANLAASVLVFLLCTSISMCSLIEHPVVMALRYAIAILCAIFSIFLYQRMPGTTIWLSLCCAITGILNILFIENSAYPKVFYTVMSIFIAFLLCSPRVSPRCLLYAVYVHAFIVSYRFLRYGLNAHVYASSSNNYVSFYLLMPLTVYYTLLECRGERIPVFPAFVTFILSIVAMGRGGVISTAILLAGILLYSIKNLRLSHRVLFFMLLLIGGIVGIHLSRTWDIAERFNRLGMSDNGRFDIWRQYFHSVFNNKLYFWLGAKFEELPLLLHFANNLHNSFFSVHAFNGMVMLVVVFCLFLYTAFYAIRRKRFILFTCMVSLFFRGFTDQMLWGAMGTPFMLFFFMIPHVQPLYQRKWRCKHLECGDVNPISNIQFLMEARPGKN